MKKGAIYTRYSTSNQTENSTETQVSICVEYCKKYDIQVEFIFSDEETTGTNTNRQQYHNLLNVAKAKLIDCVVLYDVTRGSRDVVDWFQFRKEMKAFDIQVLSATEKIGDILNPDDFLTELIHVGIGQHAVLQSRQKSIDAKYNKAKHGAFLGGFAPLGYDIVNQQYVINEKEAEVVRRIFELYNQGYTYDKILEDIKQFGVSGKRGRPISKSTLNGLLQNQRYIGRYSWMENINREMHKWVGKKNDNAVIIEDAIPAIIDKETFYKAQERIKNRQIRASKNAKREYLLSNLIFCGECGQLMRGSTVKNGKGQGETVSYICKGKREDKNCSMRNVPAFVVEDIVREKAKEWITKLNIDKMIEKIVSEAKNLDKVDTSIFEKEIRENEIKKQRLIEAIMNGCFAKEINDKIEELNLRNKYLQNKVNEEINKSLNIDENALKIKIRSLTNDLNKNDDLIVKEFVKCVIAHDNGELDIYLGISKNNGRASNWLPR